MITILPFLKTYILDYPVQRWQYPAKERSCLALHGNLWTSPPSHLYLPTSTLPHRHLLVLLGRRHHSLRLGRSYSDLRLYQITNLMQRDKSHDIWWSCWCCGGEGTRSRWRERWGEGLLQVRMLFFPSDRVESSNKIFIRTHLNTLSFTFYVLFYFNTYRTSFLRNSNNIFIRVKSNSAKLRVWSDHRF